MTVTSLKKRRLIAAFYFLISYFSIFFCQLALDGPFKKYRGFTDDYINVNENTIFISVVYVLLFNILFALSEVTVWGIFSRGKTIRWSLPQNRATQVSRVLFAMMLFFGGIWYYFKMQGVGYRGYVEYKESNWPSVFFIASSAFITFSALQKKYVIAFIATTPFLYFVFALQVRSLALVSLVPATLILFFSIYTGDTKNSRLRAIFAGIFILTLLLTVSFVTNYLKGGKIGLPDAGMPYGFAAMVQKTLDLRFYTEWNSLQKYLLNILSPFYKIFRIELPVIQDTPVHMAWLIDGVPRDWRVYYHYPALVYADAFVSFGRAGVFLGLLWGAVSSLLEIIMARGSYCLGIFLPIYTWHTYMICRGSIAVAAGPFTYVVYVVAIIGIIVHLIFSNKESANENT